MYPAIRVYGEISPNVTTASKIEFENATAVGFESCFWVFGSDSGGDDVAFWTGFSLAEMCVRVGEVEVDVACAHGCESIEYSNVLDGA